MIVFEGLSKCYRGSTKKAVDNLSFRVEAGEIFGFLGPNGAGKSTTIKCLTGILSFTEGNIKICDKDVKTDAIEAKRHIGYVPDEHITYEGLKAIEYINFIADVFGVSIEDRKERIARLSQLFGLEDRLNDSISSYSHGMKQKLSIISALVHDPDVWVLDEPMTGLDPQSAYNLKQLMLEHASRGKVVFFSSHVLDVVEKICTKVAIIDKGKLVAVGDIDALKKQQEDGSLEELFLNLTNIDDKKTDDTIRTPDLPQKKRGLFSKKDDLL